MFGRRRYLEVRGCRSAVESLGHRESAQIKVDWRPSPRRDDPEGRRRRAVFSSAWNSALNALAVSPWTAIPPLQRDPGRCRRTAPTISRAASSGSRPPGAVGFPQGSSAAAVMTSPRGRTPSSIVAAASDRFPRAQSAPGGISALWPPAGAMAAATPACRAVDGCSPHW